jgi:hypothetical protein
MGNAYCDSFASRRPSTLYTEIKAIACPTRADCVFLDTETRSADATAQEIIQRFDLMPFWNS